MSKKPLYILCSIVTALVAIGLCVLISASEAKGLHSKHHDAFFFFNRQLIYIAVGVVLTAITAWFDYHKFRNWPWLTILGYALVCVLLVVVFAMPARNGSRRWIMLPSLQLQPSEMAKLMVVIAISVWMDITSWRVEQFKHGLLYPMFILLVPLGLVVLEPDYGAAGVIGAVAFLIMFVAGTRLKHMIPVGVLGAAGVGVMVAHNPNRVHRLMQYCTSMFGSSGGKVLKLDQADNALVAFKNAEIWGVGFGRSMQKEHYLPEMHTDFIFAIGAEEFGIVFALGVILLFVALLVCAIIIARRANDRLGRYLVVGMTFLIFFQAMFNICVVCKALPTKGVALPFFSYGGTNMLSTFFAIGIILSVGIHTYRDFKRVPRRNVGA